ncbi:unnamed protein product [Oreochromis niloticus]|nr:unnamed protein product [Mustela putorius furo]
MNIVGDKGIVAVRNTFLPPPVIIEKGQEEVVGISEVPPQEVVSNIVQHRRIISLEGLLIFVRADETKLFLTCLDTDPVERATQSVTVGILTVLEHYVEPNLQSTGVNTSTVLEEDIILDDLPDLPTAFAYLFGLLYGLNMEFPKELKYTFVCCIETR